MIRPDRKSALAALRYVTTLVASVRRAHPQRMCDRSPGLYLSRLRSLSEPIPQPTPSVVPGNKNHVGEPTSPLHMALGPQLLRSACRINRPFLSGSTPTTSTCSLGPSCGLAGTRRACSTSLTSALTKGSFGAIFQAAP